MDAEKKFFLWELLLCLLLSSLATLQASGTGASRGLQITVDRYQQNWAQWSPETEKNIQVLIDLLQRSVVGKEVILRARKKAQKQGIALEQILTVGQGSATDTTLVRKFSKSHPEQMSFEMRYQIILNNDLSILDAVLDLVHELVHYADRDVFNPYLPAFNLTSFIYSTVEGEGGEVDAFLTECRVLRELFQDLALKQSRCAEVIDQQTGEFSRPIAIKKFYHLGALLKKFFAEITPLRAKAEDFPFARPTEAIFISSAYSLPYPLAAVREYQSIMLRVCQNDERRIHLMKEKVTRQAVLTDKKLAEAELKQMTEQFFIRCENIEY